MWHFTGWGRSTGYSYSLRLLKWSSCHLMLKNKVWTETDSVTIDTLQRQGLSIMHFKEIYAKPAFCCDLFLSFNWSPSSAAFMCQWTGSSLVQVMACRLFGAKPLHEPMVPYCQLDSGKQISGKFELKFYHFHPRKCIWNCRLPKWQPFCPRRDQLKFSHILKD